MRLVLLFSIAIFLAACGKNEQQPKPGPAPAAAQPQYSTTYLENKKRKEQAEPPNIVVQVQGLPAGGVAQLLFQTFALGDVMDDGKQQVAAAVAEWT